MLFWVFTGSLKRPHRAEIKEVDMVLWAIIVGALAVFEILGLYLDFPEELLYVVPILILLAALAALYRIYRKIKEGEKERLQRELKKYKEEN
mgnify:CR=1 FL=1